MDRSSYSLPDGQILTMSLGQARAVWAIWRGLAPVVALRGEGIQFNVLPSRGEVDVEITTVYAPLWEAVRVFVSPSGVTVDCSEQSAPDWEPLPGPGPWASSAARWQLPAN